jgi:hypothetical protein
VEAWGITLLIQIKRLRRWWKTNPGAAKYSMSDKERRSEVLDITKQLSKDLKKERKVYIAAVEDYLDLHQTYEAASEDFDAQLEAVMGQQQHLIETTLDAREAMKEHMTADEWHSVFKEQQ